MRPDARPGHPRGRLEGQFVVKSQMLAVPVLASAPAFDPFRSALTMGLSAKTSVEPRRRAGLSRFVPLALLVAAAALAVGMGWHRQLSLEALVRHRAEIEALLRDHYAVAVVAFVAVYIVSVALSVPGAAFLSIASGALFGWLLGGVLTVVGATIGATAVFLVARSALAELVARRIGPQAAKLADGFRADAFSYLLFLRLVPVFPFWLVNLAPALLGVPLATYVTATILGILPGTFAFAAFGAGLDSIIGAQEAAYRACLAAGRNDCRLDFDLKAALTPQMLAALVALGCLALVPVAVRHWRSRRNPSS